MLGKISMKKLAVILGIVFITCGVISGLIFFMQYGISGFNPEKLENYENKVDDEKKADLQGINTIHAESISHDITLISTDSNEVKAHFYGGYSSSSKSYKPELVVTRNGENLLIKVEDNVDGLMFSYRSNLKLDVYIPSQYSKSIEVKTESGEVASGEFSIKELSLETTSGDIKTEFINAEKAIMSTNSGETNFKGKFTELNANSTSGDIISDNIVAINTNFESNSGKINFKGNSSELNVKSTSGDIISDNFEAITTKLESDSGKIAVSGSLISITAKSTSGDISLSSSVQPQAILITTNSGETKVKLPDSAGFKLNCRSNSGEVSADYPITITDTGKKNEHELNGTVGDGSGSVTITSTSGDISVIK